MPVLPMIYPPRTVAEAKQETHNLLRYSAVQMGRDAHLLEVALDNNHQEMVDQILDDVRRRCQSFSADIERYILARQLTQD